MSNIRYDRKFLGQPMHDDPLAEKYSFYLNITQLYTRGLSIQRVIFNGPATIVFWSDGTKTIVKCMEDDIYDQEKGLAMAICKKVLGNNFKRTFKEYIEKDEESDDFFVNNFRDLDDRLKKLINNLKF